MKNVADIAEEQKDCQRGKAAELDEIQPEMLKALHKIRGVLEQFPWTGIYATPL